jgi:glycosyltransferase involved in cell wall biosynthesis
MLDEPQASASRDWARSEFGLSDRMPVVLLIAANVSEVHKGMEFALQALDAVRLNHSPQILLLGRNSERLARRVSGYRVVCGEASTNERLALAYRAADVTLVPSLAESLSAPMSEGGWRSLFPPVTWLKILECYSGTRRYDANWECEDPPGCGRIVTWGDISNGLSRITG